MTHYFDIDIQDINIVHCLVLTHLFLKNNNDHHDKQLVNYNHIVYGTPETGVQWDVKGHSESSAVVNNLCIMHVSMNLVHSIHDMCIHKIDL